MKLFVDTGNVKDIEALAAIGILDGVTTNPSLLAREADDPRTILKRICEIVQGPVSGEVVATDADGMVREGRDIAAIDPHMVVKVPFTRDGVRAYFEQMRPTLAGSEIAQKAMAHLLDAGVMLPEYPRDRKSTRLNSSH